MLAVALHALPPISSPQLVFIFFIVSTQRCLCSPLLFCLLREIRFGAQFVRKAETMKRSELWESLGSTIFANVRRVYHVGVERDTYNGSLYVQGWRNIAMRRKIQVGREAETFFEAAKRLSKFSLRAISTQLCTWQVDPTAEYASISSRCRYEYIATPGPTSMA